MPRVIVQHCEKAVRVVYSEGIADTDMLEVNLLVHPNVGLDVLYAAANRLLPDIQPRVFLMHGKRAMRKPAYVNLIPRENKPICVSAEAFINRNHTAVVRKRLGKHMHRFLLRFADLFNVIHIGVRHQHIVGANELLRYQLLILNPLRHTFHHDCLRLAPYRQPHKRQLLHHTYGALFPAVGFLASIRQDAARFRSGGLCVGVYARGI